MSRISVLDGCFLVCQLSILNIILLTKNDREENFSQHDDFDENQGLCQEKIKPVTLDRICCY